MSRNVGTLRRYLQTMRINSQSLNINVKSFNMKYTKARSLRNQKYTNLEVEVSYVESMQVVECLKDLFGVAGCLALGHMIFIGDLLKQFPASYPTEWKFEWEFSGYIGYEITKILFSVFTSLSKISLSIFLMSKYINKMLMKLTYSL